MSTPIRLDEIAHHVDVEPGGEIVVRGSFKSTRDGSEIDAATTQWPANAPGGESIDSGGMVDFSGGGFHVTSRDPATHEVHAVATGKEAPACAAAAVAAPCLPLRVLPQARTRLITMSEWQASLNGQMTLEVIAPPGYAPAAQAASSPILQGIAAAALACVIAGVAWTVHKRRARSPAGQLLILARRVRAKLGGADAVVAAPLVPAVDAALRALRERRVDATSAEGRRVVKVLQRVEAALDETEKSARAEEEQRVADELVLEVESALEAADEAMGLGPRRPGARADRGAP